MSEGFRDVTDGELLSDFYDIPVSIGSPVRRRRRKKTRKVTKSRRRIRRKARPVKRRVRKVRRNIKRRAKGMMVSFRTKSGKLVRFKKKR